jgi:hypothetical protein
VTIEVPEGCCRDPLTRTNGAGPKAPARLQRPRLRSAQTTPLRARAFLSGYNASDVASQTYIIYTAKSTIENHTYTLPVVSIVTEPDIICGIEDRHLRGWRRLRGGYGRRPSATKIAKDDTNWNLLKLLGRKPKSHPDPLGRTWERDVHFDYIDANGTTCTAATASSSFRASFLALASK